MSWIAPAMTILMGVSFLALLLYITYIILVFIVLGIKIIRSKPDLSDSLFVKFKDEILNFLKNNRFHKKIFKIAVAVTISAYLAVFFVAVIAIIWSIVKHVFHSP